MKRKYEAIVTGKNGMDNTMATLIATRLSKEFKKENFLTRTTFGKSAISVVYEERKTKAESEAFVKKIEALVKLYNNQLKSFFK